MSNLFLINGSLSIIFGWMRLQELSAHINIFKVILSRSLIVVVVELQGQMHLVATAVHPAHQLAAGQITCTGGKDFYTSR